MKIEDGTGNGNEVKVDDENRMHVHSFGVDIDTASALQGDAFDICSGLITLTSANESALLYIKNNENDDLILSLQFVNLNASTNGVGESTVKYYINPTGGTIVSGASDAGVINRKIGDANTLTADVFKGAEANTLTGGSNIEFPSTGFASSSPFVLPKGATLGIAIIPPTSNTSMVAAVGLYVIKGATKHGND